MILFFSDCFVITLVQFQCCFCFVIRSVRLRSFSSQCHLSFHVRHSIAVCQLCVNMFVHDMRWMYLRLCLSAAFSNEFHRSFKWSGLNEILWKKILFLSKHFCMLWTPMCSNIHQRQNIIIIIIIHQTHWKCVFHICLNFMKYDSQTDV